MEELNAVIAEVQKVFRPAPVYAIGGCVRDGLLGRVPKDYDFATPLLPEEIEARIKAVGRKAYMTGARFGTIGFKVNIDGKFLYVEVTTYRKEQYELGSRKPAVVFIPELTEDQSRRDLTINSIALGADGTLHDPYGGRIDLLERKIKPVGDAKERFKEDPLRILRAARFAAQLGFDVDPNMVGKARRLAPSIQNVSRERWVQELDKLLLAPHPAKGLQVLADMHVLRYMLPELWLQITENEDELWQQTLKTVEAAPRDADERWVALLWNIGKPFVRAVDKYGSYRYVTHQMVRTEMAVGIAKRLKWSNQRTNEVLGQLKKVI